MRTSIAFCAWAILSVLAASPMPAQSSRPTSAPTVVKSDPTVFLEGKDRVAFLAKVESRMSKVKSFVATFEQETNLAIFKDPVRTTGFLLFESPDRVRWEIDEPFRSILVVSGTAVAKFEFVDGKRRPLKLGRGADALLAVMSRLRLWFQGRFDASDGEFDLDVADRPSPLVRLRPKSKDSRAGIAAIELRLTAELDAVATVTLRERSGDTTTMSYRTAARDVVFGEGVFSTVDPKGVDVKSFAERPAPESRKH